VGMGRELYHAFPIFKDAFDETCVQLDGSLGCSLRSVVFGEGEDVPSLPVGVLDRTMFTQAALFALEVALFRLLDSWGLRPDFLIGHSVGELAAAHVAGVFALEDACRLVAARGELMESLSPGGAMMAVQASEQEILETIAAGSREGVGLAAVNGPSSVVISGDEDAVLGVAAEWEREGRKTRRLRVSHAFHSHRMDAMLEAFEQVAETVSYSSSVIPIVSNLTGRPAAAEELCTAHYWARHVRETVRFADGVQWLGEQGVSTFLELGPGGALSAMVEEHLGDCDLDGLSSTVAPLLRPARPERQTLAEALAQAWCGGMELDWQVIVAHRGGQRTSLPTYAFQRERFWLTGRGLGNAASMGQSLVEHPLLGAAVGLADGGWLFTGRLCLDEHSWLADHVVLGRVVFPGTAFLELAFYVGGRLGCDVVSELTLQTPLVLEGRVGAQLQVRVGEVDEFGVRSLSIYSRVEGVAGEDGEGEWTCHAVGSLGSVKSGTSLDGLALAENEVWPPVGAERVPVDDVYDGLVDVGLEYGPIFQGLSRAWRRGDEVFAEVGLPDDEVERAGLFGLHPALLDAALHAVALADLGDGVEAPGGLRLPFSWSDVALISGGASMLRVRVSHAGPEVVSIGVSDENGRLVASVGSLATRSVSAGDLGGSERGRQDAMFGLEWVEDPNGALASPGVPVRLATCAGGLCDALRSAALVCEVFADMDTLSGALAGEGAGPEVVLLDARSVDVHGVCEGDLGSFAAQGGSTSAGEALLEGIPGTVKAGLHRVLGFLQEWLANERFAALRLVVVTQGAVAVDALEGIGDLSGSAVWGLVRSAQAENPGAFMLVDVDGEDSSWGVLGRALELSEPQVALRDGVVRVARLASVYGGEVLASPRDGAWSLDVEREGTFEGLALVASPRANEALAADEVRVEVRAAGLNFRDVLVALGMYPGEASVGGEGAGVVVEVGSGGEDLSPGDRVMGLMSGAMGTMAVTDSRLVVRIPEGWSFTQAASAPIACATAYYALVDLAGLKPGERLLVHAGAGGVGMAAVQIARHLGAEVFATASPGKWDALRELGVADTHMASSRTLDFKDEFAKATDGQGMDVVLNSLAGEFVDASLGLLGEGGRLMEMGKTDIRDAGELAEEYPGVTYRAFDLMEAGPDRLREVLVELVGLFEHGVLELAPLTTWSVRRAQQAFRHMSQGQHVGKNVLRLPATIDPDGTVLVTGGAGGLGELVARHLVVEHKARHLLLASRRGPRAAGASGLVDELSLLGARVEVVACDVAQRDQVEELLAGISQEHPLDAVVHTAGVVDDGVIGSLTPGRIDHVLAPKVAGAWNLHQLTRETDLSAFILFSSMASVLGSPGQGNYAAANAFLDALAVHRLTLGLTGTSIAWGLWKQQSEMTGHLDELDHARMNRMGVLALSAEEGLALLDQALATNEPLVISARLDKSALRTHARDGVLPPLLHNVIGTPSRRAPGASTSSFAQLLMQTPQDQRSSVVLDLVRSHAARALGHSSPGVIGERSTFKELGFDSLAGVELRNRLASQTGLRLPATLVFDYPTPVVLAGYLLGEFAGVRLSVGSQRLVGAVDEPLALVGIGCRYPGGVSSPGELWDLVCSATDAVGPFPDDRGWDLESVYGDDSGGAYARRGGFLYESAQFDAAFFGIGPREALAMDPQQRLLLEVSWEALEDAGIDPFSLKGSQTGVFAGASFTGYGLSARVEGREGYGLTGGAASVISGRVAYTFGFEGPAVTVDTACSSSLVALHLACQALRGGECSLALAGGVTVISSPVVFSEFARQGGLASDGRCKAFADSADGVGWSEGVGMVVLERLSDALRNGHEVLAVVRGSAVNQDGASNGLTAPNGPSQQRVIMQALGNAGLSSSDVDVVEAHGTGTTLGDPIEAQALLATYGQQRDEEHPLWLGSIKSNIGHTQAAAGVAGVIKMVMALRHGLLPRTLHVDRSSTHVDWSAGMVSLLTEEVSWPDNARPRRAGVSSFGISGTNAHVILEQAEEPERLVVEGDGDALPGLGVLPWALSAKSDAALSAQAERLRELVLAEPDLRPQDIAFSLADRTTFEHRAVILGENREELLKGLTAISTGEQATGVVTGNAGDGRLVFVFPGQGSQWAGMAVDLLDHSPVFRDRLAECGRALAPFVTWSLENVLRGVRGEPSLDQVDVVQPALFAVMVSLAELWRACGVRPDVVVGHSQGEIAAACVAGALSLQDAARVITARSSALVALAGRGGMVSVAAS